MKKERTLTIIKHDGVARGLMGEVVKRFEKVGLKLVALEFLETTEDMGDSHYPDTKEWYEKVGNRTLNDYKTKGIDPKEKLGTADAIEIGKIIKQWNVDYLRFGPVLAMVWEGPDAVALVRKLVGETIPSKALPGTIRGDLALDNIDSANSDGRPLYNVIHASGEIAEAKEEIALWFGEREVLNYKTYSNYLTGVSGKLEERQRS